jgi:hypothetical protein
MTTRAKILAGALLLVAVLQARDKTDVIVMENGDRMTGEIKGLNSGVLRVSLDYVDGTLSVEWSKVKRLESSQLFIVQEQDGSYYTGTLTSPEGARDKIEIAMFSNTKTVLERSRVVGLEETSETFLQRLSGDISIGAVYSKGNNTTQYTLGSEVEYLRERWGIQNSVNSNLSASSGANTSTRNQVDINAYRLTPWKNYFYGGLATFLQSSVQGIDRQTSLGVGIGRFFKNTNRARVSLLGGVAWQATKYEPSKLSIPAQEDASALIAGNVGFFLFKKTNLSLRAYLFPSLTDAGRIRFNTNATYYLKVFGNLSWNLSFYGNWDTRPPPTFSGSDYGYSSGLTWTFGYK